MKYLQTTQLILVSKIHKDSDNSIENKIQLKTWQRTWTFFQRKYLSGQEVHERYSIPLIIEIEMKTRIRDHLRPVEGWSSKYNRWTLMRMWRHAGLCTIHGNLSWHSHYRILKKLKLGGFCLKVPHRRFLDSPPPIRMQNLQLQMEKNSFWKKPRD